MRSVTSKIPLVRGNLLRHSALAEAVAHRAAQVAGLLLRRRKAALAYRRTETEEQRLALARIDRDLAVHNIDIPAVQRRAKGH